MKAVLRGKLIALSAHIRKMEKAHINDLTALLKALENYEILMQRTTNMLLHYKTNSLMNTENVSSNYYHL